MTEQPLIAFAWNAAVGIPLLVVGLILLALIWLFGQPKKEQGKRRVVGETHSHERREPTVGGASLADDPFFTLDEKALGEVNHAASPAQGELEVGLREELERLGATLSGEHSAAKPRSRLMGSAASIVDALRAPSNKGTSEPTPVVASHAAPPPPAAPREVPHSGLGRRPADLPVERIVTLFVVAREGQHFNGPDLVVATEKAGLEFGDMNIYHRLVDGKRELGPIFSVANMLKPGNFDLARLDALHTPGVSFFMTLPAPIPALDAWDAMLPTAQRMAELLDGQVLDEERNALGRQGIAHIRDQLRGWDRDHEGNEIIFGR
ncbi:MAG: cell division protein ZipA [Rhodanobacter sp.]